MSAYKMPKILKDENGKSIPCACSGCNRMARHIHHNTPRCQGGTDDTENLVALCQKCHVAHHSNQGDFKAWGRVGGQITAQTGKSIPNLKQFQGEAGRARWEQYQQRRADAALGVN
jgi:hypothetical protein